MLVLSSYCQHSPYGERLYTQMVCDGAFHAHLVGSNPMPNLTFFQISRTPINSLRFTPRAQNQVHEPLPRLEQPTFFSGEMWIAMNLLADVTVPAHLILSRFPWNSEIHSTGNSHYSLLNFNNFWIERFYISLTGLYLSDQIRQHLRVSIRKFLTFSDLFPQKKKEANVVCLIKRW